MTSRERVLAAFRHEEPDRTPIFEKLIKSPIADELLGRPCAATNFHLQMEFLAAGDWEGLQRQTARDLVDLSVSLGFDMVRLYPNGLPPAPEQRPRRLNAHTWQVGGVITELLPTGWVRTRAAVPPPGRSEEEQEAALRADLTATPSEPSFDDRQFAMFRHAMRIIREEGHDLAVFSQVYGMGAATLPPFVLRWLITEPQTAHRHFERGHAYALAMCRRLIREGADIIGLGGDLACDLGPMISPAHYREFIMPRIRAQARLCRSEGAFSTNATDGDIWAILDDFLLGAEVDGYEEIDFAAGMDLARLKARYGDRCTFMGNIDIRHTLTASTPEQVREHTLACIRDGWGGGGHVVMSSNCIHESCRTELFLAHLAAYRSHFGLPALSL